MTTTNQFFEVRLNIVCGTTNRKALDKKTLKQLGFNDADIEEVKAVLSTTVLPKDVFDKPLAIKRATQEYLATKGHNHPLVGRVFNPKDRVEIVQKLVEKKDEYEAWKADFLARYESLKGEQLLKVQKSAEAKEYDPLVFIDAVKAAQPRREYFERRLGFDFLDLSVTLDTEQWADLIKKINSDLVEKTIYELSRDAAKARDIELPRNRVKSLTALAEKLESLDFYVKGTKAIAQAIRTHLNGVCGGLKANADYSPREGLALSGVAKVLEVNSKALVKGEIAFSDVFATEGKRIEALLREDEEQLDIEDEIDALSESKPSSPEVPEVPQVPQPKTPATSGAFSF